MTISILFDGTSPQTEKKAAMFLVSGWGEAKGSRAQDQAQPTENYRSAEGLRRVKNPTPAGEIRGRIACRPIPFQDGLTRSRDWSKSVPERIRK